MGERDGLSSPKIVASSTAWSSALRLPDQVRAFVLVSGNLTAQEMAKIFVRALPKMRKLAAKHSPPFIAKILKDGSVVLWADD